MSWLKEIISEGLEKKLLLINWIVKSGSRATIGRQVRTIQTLTYDRLSKITLVSSLLRYFDIPGMQRTKREQ